MLQQGQSGGGERAGGPRLARDTDNVAAKLVGAVATDVENVLVSRLRTATARIGSRTRWLIVVIIAALVLLWAAVVIFGNSRGAEGPYLLDALEGPYDLEARARPAAGADLDALLPIELDQYTLQTETTSVALSSPLSECLLKADDYYVACGITYRAQRVVSGEYRNAETEDAPPAEVVAAIFWTDEPAEQVMVDLFRYSRTIGRVGNYALRRVAPVDYFYSSSGDWFSFTWSRNQWIFSVSSTSFETLEAVSETFPY